MELFRLNVKKVPNVTIYTSIIYHNLQYYHITLLTYHSLQYYHVTLFDLIFLSFSCVRELLSKDHSAANDEDENSNTPLHLAALSGHSKVANILLNNGADVSAR